MAVKISKLFTIGARFVDAIKDARQLREDIDVLIINGTIKALPLEVQRVLTKIHRLLVKVLGN